MIMNMKTICCTDESRESPNEPDGINKGWRFNGDNSAMEIGRQQSGSVGMIWGKLLESSAPLYLKNSKYPLTRIAPS